MSHVVTGEAVPLELRLANFPSRALAILIDALAYGLVGFGLYSLVTSVVPGLDEALSTAMILAAGITLLVVVPATIETLTRGKSLGKLVLGLRVVRDDGGPIRARHALVRALSGVFADFILTSGVGAVFCSLLNERGKRIGDVLAGTVVLRERVPGSTALPPMPPELASWAKTLELSQLPNDLALAVRSYLTRSHQLAPATREELATRLANQVLAVTSPPPPAGLPAWTYLAVVMNERARRESLRLSGDPASAPAGPSTRSPHLPTAPTGPPAAAPPDAPMRGWSTPPAAPGLPTPPAGAGPGPAPSGAQPPRITGDHAEPPPDAAAERKRGGFVPPA